MYRNNCPNSNPNNSNLLISNSKPINIPSNKLDTQYSFKLSTIDPTNSSPPNSWNNRLISRINCYDNPDQSH